MRVSVRMSLETHILSLLICPKRPTYMPKETYSCCIPKEIYLYAKRDLLICQKRPTYKSAPHVSARMSPETLSISPDCSYAKRDLHFRQKRPTFLSKETCFSAKRDLLISSTGVCKDVTGNTHSIPTYMPKEDLLFCQKRPNYKLTGVCKNVTPNTLSIYTYMPKKTNLYAKRDLIISLQVSV